MRSVRMLVLLCAALTLCAGSAYGGKGFTGATLVIHMKLEGPAGYHTFDNKAAVRIGFTYLIDGSWLGTLEELKKKGMECVYLKPGSGRDYPGFLFGPFTLTDSVLRVKYADRKKPRLVSKPFLRRNPWSDPDVSRRTFSLQNRERVDTTLPLRSRDVEWVNWTFEIRTKRRYEVLRRFDSDVFHVTMFAEDGKKREEFDAIGHAVHGMHKRWDKDGRVIHEYWCWYGKKVVTETEFKKLREEEKKQKALTEK